MSSRSERLTDEGPVGRQADAGGHIVPGLRVLVAFALGRLNAYFLTCDDFTISGNYPPPGCTPGPYTRR